MRVLNVVKCNNKIAYYECVDAQGRPGKLTKDQLINEIRAKRCENARMQVYRGLSIIRVGSDVGRKTCDPSYANMFNNNNVAHVNANTIKQQHAKSMQPKMHQNYLNYNAKLAEQNSKPSILSGNRAIDRLIHTEIGTPLKVKVSDCSGFEQVIFMGIRDIQSRESFVFFNGSGVDGTFGLSSKFIENNTEQIQFTFNDNIPEKVTQLLSMIKG